MKDKKELLLSAINGIIFFLVTFFVYLTDYLRFLTFAVPPLLLLAEFIVFKKKKDNNILCREHHKHCGFIIYPYDNIYTTTLT